MEILENMPFHSKKRAFFGIIWEFHLLPICKKYRKKPADSAVLSGGIFFPLFFHKFYIFISSPLLHSIMMSKLLPLLLGKHAAAVDVGPTYGKNYAVDVGPTYGKDYAGQDYNITNLHSSTSASTDHYNSIAVECETACATDPQCCAWTYVPPNTPDGSPERCCLKNSVPSELTVATHWTGLAARAVNKKGLSPKCDVR